MYLIQLYGRFTPYCSHSYISDLVNIIYLVVHNGCFFGWKLASAGRWQLLRIYKQVWVDSIHCRGHCLFLQVKIDQNWNVSIKSKYLFYFLMGINNLKCLWVIFIYASWNNFWYSIVRHYSILNYTALKCFKLSLYTYYII